MNCFVRCVRGQHRRLERIGVLARLRKIQAHGSVAQSDARGRNQNRHSAGRRITAVGCFAGNGCRACATRGNYSARNRGHGGVVARPCDIFIGGIGRRHICGNRICFSLVHEHFRWIEGNAGDANVGCGGRHQLRPAVVDDDPAGLAVAGGAIAPCIAVRRRFFGDSDGGGREKRGDNAAARGSRTAHVHAGRRDDFVDPLIRSGLRGGTRTDGKRRLASGRRICAHLLQAVVVVVDREFEGVAAFGQAAKRQIHVDVQRVDVLVGCQRIGEDGLGADVFGAFDRGHDLLDRIGTIDRATKGEQLALFQRAAGQACP